MGNKKTIGISLLVVGAILLISSLTVDLIGVGSSDNFGYKQILGTIVGVTAAVVGFVIYSRK